MKLRAFLYLFFFALSLLASAQHFTLAELPAVRKQCWAHYTDTLTRRLLPTKLPRLQEAQSRAIFIPTQLEKAANNEAVSMHYYYGWRCDSPDTLAKGEALNYHPKLPFYLYLHGSGFPLQEWATGLKLCNSFAVGKAFYVVPRIPQTGEWYRWYQKGKQWVWNQLFREALAHPDIDARRLYLFGISEGGYGSQRLASFYADYLAAATPMAGGEPLKNAPVENLQHIAFSLRTGADDHGFYRNKLTTYTKRALDSIQQIVPNAFTHRVELIPNRGHFIDYAPSPLYASGFLRHAVPSNFIWEDFEMDGVHRQGFYNLAVDARPVDSLRTRYDFRVERGKRSSKVFLTVQNVHYTTTEIDPRFGIHLQFSRRYTPAQSGRVTLFFDEMLVDLARPVVLYVNGKRVFKGKLQLTRQTLSRALNLWGDPARLFPASLTVDVRACRVSL